jgi:hypothetical protein
MFFKILIDKTDGYNKIFNEIQMKLFEIFPKREVEEKDGK